MIFAARIRLMVKKRHIAEEIVAKLRQVDVLTAQGRQAVDAVGLVTAGKWLGKDEHGARNGHSDKEKLRSDLKGSKT